MNFKNIQRRVVKQLKPTKNGNMNIKQIEEFLPILSLIELDDIYQNNGWKKSESPDWINSKNKVGLEITSADSNYYASSVAKEKTYAFSNNDAYIYKIIEQKIEKLNKYYMKQNIVECDLYIISETNIRSDTDSLSFDEHIENINDIIQNIYLNHKDEKSFKNIYIETTELKINENNASPIKHLLMFQKGTIPIYLDKGEYDKYKYLDMIEKYRNEKENDL